MGKDTLRGGDDKEEGDTHIMYNVMKRTARAIGRCRRVLLGVALATGPLCASFSSSAAGYDASLPYDQARPLVVAVDWNMAPYEFTDDRGEPRGYNVDMLKTMLGEIGVPYRFVTSNRKGIIMMFKEGKADMMIDIVPANGKREPRGHYSRRVLATYKTAMAYKAGTTPIARLKDLDDGSTLSVRSNDYAAYAILARNDVNPRQIRVNTPRTCLDNVADGRYTYFVYGEVPMARTLKKNGIRGVDMTDIDIPPGEMRMLANNEQLIELLDDQFTRLEQAGTKNKIYNRWLHPEAAERDVPPTVLLAVFIVLAVVAILLAVNRIISKKVKRINRRATEKIKLMQAVLNMSDCYVLLVDIDKWHIYNMHGTLLPTGGMPIELFIAKTHPEERPEFKRYFRSVLGGINNFGEGYNFRWNKGTTDNPQWLHFYCNAITEQAGKRHRNLICAVTDITDEVAMEHRDRETTIKYTSIFDRSMVGIALYDSRGQLLNANAAMRATLKYKDDKDDFWYRQNLYSLLFNDTGMTPEQLEDRMYCTLCERPERDVHEYLELRICPIRNSDGKLLYILVSARRITGERELYLQQKESNERVKRVSQDTANYEDNLRYLLEESNTKIWRSSFAQKKIRFYKNLYEVEAEMTMDDFVRRADNDEDSDTARAFIDPAPGTVTPVTVSLKMKGLFDDDDDKRRYYSVNRIPQYDLDGKLKGCFGLIRDTTTLMEAQDRLREETARANDSEQQKSAFLANMSHEIRTPLNAIVGFSDLLPSIDDHNERMELIRIIHKNCDMLIHLINDILTVSTMDSDGPSIVPRSIDFAKAFDDLCATLAIQVADMPDVVFIKDNPYKKFVTMLDVDRVQQIIINFTTNAVKFTKKGYIKVGYRQQDEGICIYCEDTGKGIPEEKRQDIFRRFVKLNSFVQGTGLGLNICKAITDKCGGSIGVESVPDRGSTFHAWIPCPIGETERKDDAAQ